MRTLALFSVLIFVIAVANAEECKDVAVKCEDFYAYCDQANMQRNCAKTCGACGKTTTAHPFPPNCQDKINSCKQNADKCHETKWQYWCPVTCHTAWSCHDSTSSTRSTTAKTTTTPKDGCVDISAGCEKFKKYCNQDTMKLNCAKTCGTCGGYTPTTFPPSCTDKINSCKQNADKCHETKWQYWCPKTCAAAWSCNGGSKGTGTTPTRPTRSTSRVTRPPPPDGCEDAMPRCQKWAEDGACDKVSTMCKKSCKDC